ncbi:hypothetical protein [Fibrella forsythiae]|uniref:Uncharacterized protein n=1 Tax=Fibrella forsythiae TaxID=2817061 RepID=A0ABS3JNB6_9BACT|nr:hypothetical protein [Fibrella forsythiae]MBO0951492.1 hypothetical protein [Fibrella forsythiae]
MSSHPASFRISSAPGFLTVGLLIGLSACQRPVAHFQRSQRTVFYSPAPKLLSPETSANVPDDSSANVPGEQEHAQAILPLSPAKPIAYARASRPVEPTNAPASGPVQSTYPVAERVRQHQDNARRLLTPAAATDTPIPVSEHQPGPKPKKTLREILGLPPRRKLNWWQRISWQLKASVIIILIAVVFAILGITLLSIVFGVIGALLLIRGLKKSFKVRRGIFGLGG